MPRYVIPPRPPSKNTHNDATDFRRMNGRRKSMFGDGRDATARMGPEIVPAIPSGQKSSYRHIQTAERRSV
jgi:hypothetical protein